MPPSPDSQNQHPPAHAVSPGSRISLKSVHDVGAEAQVQVALRESPVLTTSRAKMILEAITHIHIYILYSILYIYICIRIYRYKRIQLYYSKETDDITRESSTTLDTLSI